MLMLNENLGAPVAKPALRNNRFGLGAVKKAAVVGGVVCATGLAMAQTDATVIATQAQTAFGVIAPITITIAAFYVILRIAKRVVH